MYHHAMQQYIMQQQQNIVDKRGTLESESVPWHGEKVIFFGKRLTDSDTL